jgi:hypothetical protein
LGGVTGTLQHCGLGEGVCMIRWIIGTERTGRLIGTSCLYVCILESECQSSTKYIELLFVEMFLDIYSY